MTRLESQSLVTRTRLESRFSQNDSDSTRVTIIDSRLEDVIVCAPHVAGTALLHSAKLTNFEVSRLGAVSFGFGCRYFHNESLSRFWNFNQVSDVTFLWRKLCLYDVDFVWCLFASRAEVGQDPDYRSRLRQDSALIFRTRIRSQKFVKNRTRSHFSISAVAGVCAIIS